MIRLFRHFFSLKLFLEFLFADSKHQLDTVLLIYLRRTRIIVDGNDIGIRSDFFNLSDCALTVDMIRQTTERLCAYDILIACIGKFNHLGCQQPTLAHLTAVADNTVYKLLCVSISVRRNKAVLFSGINHKSLKLCEVVKKHRTEFVFNSASSEHLVVLNTVINLK